MDASDGTSNESSGDDSLNVEGNTSRKRYKINNNEHSTLSALNNVEIYNFSETAAVFKYNCVTNTYITFTHNFDEGQWITFRTLIFLKLIYKSNYSHRKRQKKCERCR